MKADIGKITGITRRPETVLNSLGGKTTTELFYDGRCGSGCQADLSQALELIAEGINESDTCVLDLLYAGRAQFLKFA